jgi:hypothetical protein
MRAGIGLLSLLIGVALIFYISFGLGKHGYEGEVLEQGKVAREEANQISGRTNDDMPIESTIQLDEVDAGGQFRRLRVVSIVPKTPMQTCYGLLAGDEIIRVGPMGVSDNNDAGLGKALVYEAYQRNETIDILRNGQEMTLKPTSSPLSQYQPRIFGTAPGAPAAPVPTH